MVVELGSAQVMVPTDVRVPPAIDVLAQMVPVTEDAAVPDAMVTSILLSAFYDFNVPKSKTKESAAALKVA